MQISEKIKHVRKNFRLSQERFGRKIGVSGKCISAYECGLSKPSLRILDKISDVYRVDIISGSVTLECTEKINTKMLVLKETLIEIEKLVMQMKSPEDQRLEY